MLAGPGSVASLILTVVSLYWGTEEMWLPAGWQKGLGLGVGEVPWDCLLSVIDGINQLSICWAPVMYRTTVRSFGRFKWGKKHGVRPQVLLVFLTYWWQFMVHIGLGITKCSIACFLQMPLLGCPAISCHPCVCCHALPFLHGYTVEDQLQWPWSDPSSPTRWSSFHRNGDRWVF